jgi:hypothetical protein
MNKENLILVNKEHTSKFVIKNMQPREYKTHRCKFPASYKAGRGHAVAFVVLVAPRRHKRTVRCWTWTQTTKPFYFHQLVLQPREWRKCSRPANTDSDWLRRLALTGLNVEKVTLAGAHALDATATHSTYARMDWNKYTCSLLHCSLCQLL